MMMIVSILKLKPCILVCKSSALHALEIRLYGTSSRNTLQEKISNWLSWRQRDYASTTKELKNDDVASAKTKELNGNESPSNDRYDLSSSESNGDGYKNWQERFEATLADKFSSDSRDDLKSKIDSKNVSIYHKLIHRYQKTKKSINQESTNSSITQDSSILGQIGKASKQQKSFDKIKNSVYNGLGFLSIQLTHDTQGGYLGKKSANVARNIGKKLSDAANMIQQLEDALKEAKEITLASAKTAAQKETQENGLSSKIRNVFSNMRQELKNIKTNIASRVGNYIYGFVVVQVISQCKGWCRRKWQRCLDFFGTLQRIKLFVILFSFFFIVTATMSVIKEFFANLYSMFLAVEKYFGRTTDAVKVIDSSELKNIDKKQEVAKLEKDLLE